MAKIVKDNGIEFEIIEQANPNRWPVRLIRLISMDGKPLTGYVVEETTPDDEWEFVDEGLGYGTDSLSQARRVYTERVKELSGTPNWEAQAEYDEQHGTCNGYAPWQYNTAEY